MPLNSEKEARRAEVALESYPHPLFPTLNGNLYFTKPPLHTILASPLLYTAELFALTLEQKIFLLRLISLFSYLGISFLLYLCLERNLELSLLTLFILFSSFRFLSFISRIDLEPLFVFFTTLSLYFFLLYERKNQSIYVYLFYLASGLATLVRGPLNLLLILGIYLYNFIPSFKSRSILVFLPGLIFFFLPIILWVGLVLLQFGPQAFNELLLDLKTRSLEKGDPPYYYLLSLLLNFLPYFLLLILKGKRTLSIIKKKDLLLPLIILGLSLLVLSFSGKKYDKYLLFLHPLVALFLAKSLYELYALRLLLPLALVLFFLNFSVVFALNLKQIKELAPKIEALKKELGCSEKICFASEENHLFVLLCQRRIPSCQMVPSVERLIIISPSSCPGKILKTLKDPYKKAKEWYFCEHTSSLLNLPP